MEDNENNSMFSDEYSTESTKENSINFIDKSNINNEETIFSIETENYTITKPKRIIIKATIIK
ncbi:hypothetical protein [Flavobacterium sp. GT3P67]|uniref:hypothetical protein n=1 Tax=Flavobacterium sp. GT3P67 TaxID=2541722 RepID=UPI001048D5C0|nr:hypothetical protein [Flavobacterium sp. GT3P67]TDE50105.1 hypothetical protein E0H99_14300 [Flavobacterium sp. GT3P67]